MLRHAFFFKHHFFCIFVVFHVFENLGVFCCLIFSSICSFIEFCCLSGCLLCPLTRLCVAHSLYVLRWSALRCSAVVRSILRWSAQRCGGPLNYIFSGVPHNVSFSVPHLVVFKGTFLTNTGWVFTHHGCQNVTTNLQSWFSPLKK